MPASRAVCSGSPFVTRLRRIWRRASADIRIDPRATASRAVTGLSPTSTLLTPPPASPCDSAAPPRRRRLRVLAIVLREEERQAFQRHGEVDPLQFHARRNLQRPRREIQDGLDAGRNDEIEHALRSGGGNRDDRDLDAVALGD